MDVTVKVVVLTIGINETEHLHASVLSHLQRWTEDGWVNQPQICRAKPCVCFPPLQFTPPRRAWKERRGTLYNVVIGGNDIYVCGGNRWIRTLERAAHRIAEIVKPPVEFFEFCKISRYTGSKSLFCVQEDTDDTPGAFLVIGGRQKIVFDPHRDSKKTTGDEFILEPGTLLIYNRSRAGGWRSGIVRTENPVEVGTIAHFGVNDGCFGCMCLCRPLYIVGHPFNPATRTEGKFKLIEMTQHTC